MQSFSWGPAFITGIMDIDRQHQRLVEMINSFGTTLTENHVSQETIFDLFHQLADYAKFHFSDEEKSMMEKDGDSQHLSVSISQHNDFVSDISEMATTIEMSDPEGCRPIFSFLVHWLAYRILGSDQNLARQINAIDQGSHARTGIPPGGGSNQPVHRTASAGPQRPLRSDIPMQQGFARTQPAP